MFDGFFPQISHDFLHNKRLLGFISGPRLYQENPFQLSLHISRLRAIGKK